MYSNFKRIFFLVSILFYSIGVQAQLCGNAVNAPANINGVNVTGSGTGSVDVYPSAFTSCSPGITTPANSLYLGQTGSFSYTYTFDTPVNNLVFIITAAGQPGNENFIITTNGGGTPTINSPQNCFTTINGNEILSGLNGTMNGGGGIFEVVNPAPYTTITISGSGGQNGALVALCETSVIPNPCASQEADLALDLNVDLLTPGIGCEVTFTITVTNNGPCTANLTQIQNLLPAGLTLVNTTPSVGTVTGNTWNVGDLLNAGTETLQIVAQVNASGPLTLNSSATTTSVDIDLSNNATNISIDASNITPNAGSDASDMLCQSTQANYSIPTLLSADADASGTWVETSASLSGQFNPSTGDLNIAASAIGVYTFQYESSNGCLADVAEMTVTIAGQPQLAPVLDQVVCNSYILPGIVGSNLSGNESYYTGVNGTGVQYAPGESISSNTTLYIYDVNPLAADCFAETTFAININSAVVPSFSADVLEGCAPIEVTFTNLTLDSQQCTWDFGDGSTSNNCGVVSHNYQTAGIYDVTLTIQTDDLCSGTLTMAQYITVFASPRADFTFSPNAPDILNSEVEFTNLSDNATSYEWAFGDAGTSQDVSPTHVYPEIPNSTYYVTLIASNDGICFDTIMKPIGIEDLLLFYVPNTFTPDGDEHNQVFRPILTSGFNEMNYLLQIFNRWGELIFESKNAEIGWDGTYDGRLVQDGTYSWKITFGGSNNDQKYMRKGHVMKI